MNSKSQDENRPAMEPSAVSLRSNFSPKATAERPIAGRFSSWKWPWILGAWIALFFASMASAQTPQIAGVFPAGAKAGRTVEVVLRGGNLQGAKKLLITGEMGVSAEVQPGGAPADEALRPLVQSKCTSCHELRTPDNRTMTSEQWAATVERMITQRSAQLSTDDKDKVTKYLQAKARAGVITAKVTVADQAAPGPRELRLVTDAGVSTAFTFEVGDLPETLAAEPNSKLTEAQKIQLPTTVNGTLANAAERDYFSFTAKKGETYTFDLKAFRLSELTAQFFNPVLYLYDSKGKELTKNLGSSDLDPALTWTAPADGDFTLLVRDMLWHGNPASIYRLSATQSGPQTPSTPETIDGPDFAITALPDTVNLAPGGIAAVVIRATKRQKLSTGITVSLSDLPPGITAEPCAIPPDDDKTILILRASEDARPSGGTFTVTGKALGEGRSVTRLATPLESYRGPANNQRQRPRGTESIGIRVGSDPFTLEADLDRLPMRNDERRDITVKIKRQGNFKGGIVIFPHQLPWFTYPTAGALYVPPEKNECTFTIVGTGNADHISRRAKDLAPMRFCFVGIVAGINEQPYLSTPAITVVPK